MAPWGAGSPDTGSSSSAKALALGAHRLAHGTMLPAGAPAPASSSRVQSPPGPADSQRALTLWGSHCLFSDFNLTLHRP